MAAVTCDYVQNKPSNVYTHNHMRATCMCLFSHMIYVAMSRADACDKFIFMSAYTVYNKMITIM